MELQPPDKEGMVRIAVAELAQEFDDIGDNRIEATVRARLQLCGIERA